MTQGWDGRGDPLKTTISVAKHGAVDSGETWQAPANAEVAAVDIQPTEVMPCSPSVTATQVNLPSGIRRMEDAFAEAEAARYRQIAVHALVSGPPFAMLVYLLEGDARARWAAMISIALLMLDVLWLRWFSRKSETCTGPRIASFFVISALCLQPAIYFFGFMSAAILILSIYVQLGANSRFIYVSWMTYLTFAGCHALMFILVGAGLLPDLGLISTRDLFATYDPSFATLLLAGALFQGLLGSIYFVIHQSRQTLEMAVSEAEAATRLAAQRDMLLEEARQRLTEALRSAGHGAFSGATLGGYQLGTILGRGGMGEVYRATEVQTERPVAVKVIQVAAASHSGALERFRREARLVSELESDHIVKILNVRTQNEIPFYAMELLAGEDLATILQRNGRLSDHEIIEMMEQVAEGLSVAHKAAIVHRDLKPQNIFRTGDRTWKILDFGVSAFLHEESDLTGSAVVGTPTYMAPEQAMGKPVDSRADIYSLGCVVYACLTGCAPFRAQGLAEIIHRIATERPPAPSATSGVTDRFDAVVAKALEKSPGDRFQSASELAAALREAARDSVPIAE